MIEVSETTAKNWEKISPNVRTQLEQVFAGQIDSISEKVATTDFETILRQIREEAARNGLTEERLKELLDDE